MEAMPCCGHAAEQAHDQAKGAGKFCRNGEKRQRRREVQRLGEKAHGSTVAIAAESAERLLRAVRKHDEVEREPRHKRGETAVGVADGRLGA